MKYRKKPVVVEAFQFGVDDVPMWFIYRIVNYDPQHNFIKFKTSKEDMSAEYGEMIIHDIDGEIYPCKKDIFDQTYEKVEE